MEDLGSVLKRHNKYSILSELDGDNLDPTVNKRMTGQNNENVSTQSNENDSGLTSIFGNKPEKTLTLWFKRVALTIGVIILLAVVIAAWRPLWVLARLPYFVMTGYFAKRRYWFLPFSSTKTSWFAKIAGGVCTLLMWVASVSWVALIV